MDRDRVVLSESWVETSRILALYAAILVVLFQVTGLVLRSAGIQANWIGNVGNWSLAAFVLLGGTSMLVKLRHRDA